MKLKIVHLAGGAVNPKRLSSWIRTSAWSPKDFHSVLVARHCFSKVGHPSFRRTSQGSFLNSIWPLLSGYCRSLIDSNGSIPRISCLVRKPFPFLTTIEKYFPRSPFHFREIFRPIEIELNAKSNSQKNLFIPNFDPFQFCEIFRTYDNWTKNPILSGILPILTNFIFTRFSIWWKCFTIEINFRLFSDCIVQAPIRRYTKHPDLYERSLVLETSD